MVYPADCTYVHTYIVYVYLNAIVLLLVVQPIVLNNSKLLMHNMPMPMEGPTEYYMYTYCIAIGTSGEGSSPFGFRGIVLFRSAIAMNYNLRFLPDTDDGSR